MILRTLAGRYAGELRDYALPVALAAIRSGTAELPVIKSEAPTAARSSSSKGRRGLGSKRAVKNAKKKGRNHRRQQAAGSGRMEK